MSATSFSSKSPRRRTVSFALAVAAHLLVVLLLLRLTPDPVQRVVDDAPLTTFTVAPAPKEAPTSAERTRVAPTPRASAAAASPAAAAAAAKAAAPVATTSPPPMILLPGGMELFDAADIGRMHGAPADGGDAEGAGDSVAAYGPGAGPGGQKLYNADWYRRPSDTELAGYMPAGGVPPGGWTMIACRTIEDFHVDNCRQLAEGPAGSGLARAMRLAAWQFRVRPPRLGGKAIMGAWVRICFDFDKKVGVKGRCDEG